MVFEEKHYDIAIETLANIKVAYLEKARKEDIELVDFLGCVLSEAKERLFEKKEFNADQEIRSLFGKLHDNVHDKSINNSIIQNLRDVADSPTWLFELLTSYLLAYTSKYPAAGYMEEKRKSITEWLEEIKNFGYKPQ